MSSQSFNFDKFVKDLEQREVDISAHKEVLEKQEAQWQARNLIRRYREHPLNLRRHEPND
jgi:hypothetical protein